MSAVNKEPGIYDQVNEYINSIPPVTRYTVFTTLAGISFILTSVSISLQLGLVSGKQVILGDISDLYKLQLWRLFTCHCLGKGFNLIMHCYFLYTNMMSLETTVYANRRSDFIIMLLFIVFSLDIFGYVMDSGVMTSAFGMAIIYVYSQANPNSIVNFMFGFQIKSQMFPFVLCLYDMLVGGNVMLDVIGIIVGHAYHFLENVYPSLNNDAKILQAPEFLIKMVDNDRVMGTTTGAQPIPGRNANEKKETKVFGGKGYKLE
jgi:Derlin-2/3